MSTRLFLLKITAYLAALIAGGCVPQMASFVPQPTPKPAEVPVARVELVVSGKGSVDVGGAATITAKAASQAESPALCDCGCGLSGCTCSAGCNSAASAASRTAMAGPQFITQTKKVYECRNGKCGWYDVEVRVPAASAGKRSVAPMTHGGKITVYTNGSPACVAMRAALSGVSGVEFVTISPMGMAGISMVPTAVKQDGSKWTPASGWHNGSLEEFIVWRSKP